MTIHPKALRHRSVILQPSRRRRIRHRTSHFCLQAVLRFTDRSGLSVAQLIVVSVFCGLLYFSDNLVGCSAVAGTNIRKYR
jgi:hypothetical protein